MYMWLLNDDNQSFTEVMAIFKTTFSVDGNNFV